MSEKKIRAMVIDAEPLARQRTEDLLRRDKDVEIVGTVDNGGDAPGEIREKHPDPRHGVRPVRAESLRPRGARLPGQAVRRRAVRAGTAQAREEIAHRDGTSVAERLLSLLESRPGSAGQSKYMERIAIETRGQVRVVPIGKIDFITADGPYAERAIVRIAQIDAFLKKPRNKREELERVIGVV